jgi:hypothetical protein
MLSLQIMQRRVEDGIKGKISYKHDLWKFEQRPEALAMVKSKVRYFIQVTQLVL